MIQTYTMLNSADNSGAKRIMCIKVLGGSRKRYARIGDIIVASVKEAVPNSQVPKGSVVRAVVYERQKNTAGQMGLTLSLTKMRRSYSIRKTNLRGHGVFGPVARELRDKDFTRIVSLAPEAI